MFDPPAMYRLEHAEQERQVLSSELLPQLISWVEDSSSLVLRPGEREEVRAATKWSFSYLLLGQLLLLHL